MFEMPQSNDGELKYKYIIAYPDIKSGAYQAAFGNLDENVSRFVQFMPERRIVKLIYLFAFSRRIHFPFQKKLIEAYCNKEIQLLSKEIENIKGSKPPCIITNHLFAAGAAQGIIDMLRSRFPGVKYVYYFTDIVTLNYWRLQVIQNPKKYGANLIITYDGGDAVRFGLEKFPLPYDVKQDPKGNGKCEYDICFVGRAKDRYDEIIRVYDALISQGISCSFTIITEGVRLKEFREGITYKKHGIPYEEYLDIEKKSRCILEIIQEGSCGYTTRVPEAVFLSKKLISNNKSLIADRIFDSNQLLVFDTIENIDIGFIRDQRIIEYKSEVKEIFNPMNFLSFIDEKLSKTDEN